MFDIFALKPHTVTTSALSTGLSRYREFEMKSSMLRDGDSNGSENLAYVRPMMSVLCCSGVVDPALVCCATTYLNAVE